MQLAASARQAIGIAQVARFTAPMFRIKICGITNIADALAAAAAGADAIGLNFYAESPRYVERSRAASIRDALPRGVLAVGVFVNHSADSICETCAQLKLNLAQLSGREPPELLAELAARGAPPVMPTLRSDGQGAAPLRSYIDACHRLGALPRMVLFDSFDPARFGGTGRVADWALAAECRLSGDCPPMVLAGGLRPENVAEAIHTVRPYAVDTASGVESSPGQKDAEKIGRFVAAARAAFDKLESVA
jgi:phosphoribosylanthranilate isomerase